MKMINKLKGLSIAAMCVAMASCSNDYLHNYELDDTVYLLNTGLTSASVYNWGTYEYKLAVIKSGRGNTAGSASIAVDESILSNYNAENNTTLEIMPTDCYEVSEKTINFTKDDYRKYFIIKFQAENLNVAQESGSKYVLPLKMTTNGLPLADGEVDEVIINPTVSNPYIGFERPGLYGAGVSFSIKTDNDDLMLIYPKVASNYPNEWTINYKVEVDESLLTQYNEENGTEYKMIPSAAYEIDNSTCVLRPNFDSEYMKISLFEEGFLKNAATDKENYNFGEYALPLKISSTDKYGIDPDAYYTIYPVTIIAPDVDKTSWAIDTVSCQINDEIANSTSLELAEKIIDTKTDTYWKTKWVTPDPFPYFVTIDMGELNKIYNVSFAMPDLKSIGNIKSGYIEISADRENWTKVITYERSSEAEDRKMSFDIDMVQGRYLRFVITDAFEYADPTVGKESGARCALAEIYAEGY